MNDLGPKELEMLSALKASDEPASADRERIRRRVRLAVGLAAVGTSGVGIGTQTAVAATPKLGLLATTTAKVSLVVGLATGGAVLFTQPWSTHATSNEKVDVTQPVRPPHVIETVQVELDPPAATSVVEPSAARAVVGSETPAANTHLRIRAQTPAASPSNVDLDAEIELLRAARQALQAGRFSAALDSLSEHARRFPKGVLASERQASTAIALCKSGELSTGKARAAHYLKRNPKSPLADRVRISCKLE